MSSRSTNGAGGDQRSPAVQVARGLLFAGVAWLWLAAGCGNEVQSPPEILRVDPSTVSFGLPQSAVVHGHNFHGKAQCDLDGDPPIVDRRFTVIVGQRRLAPQGVTYVDPQQLHIALPDDLELGLHALTVVTPAGRKAVLDEALEVVAVCVTDADGDLYIDEACPGGDDCDDSNAMANPAASDANCDAIDNDCDGVADDAFEAAIVSCGVGQCQATGELSCVNGAQMSSCVPAAPPEPYEVSCSDGLDNDCNGFFDSNDPICNWWDISWARRRPITFDNAAQSDDLDGFPVLIKLNPGRIDYSLMQPNGEDLRFVDADDATVLAHEIESWNPGNVSHVWVRVPRIDGASQSDFIWMYYGNGTASDDQDAAAVWSADYRAVYHLHDDLLDSSASGYHATNVGTTDAPAFIGDGQHFDGASIIDLGAGLDILRQVPGATLSAWMYADGLGAGRRWLISISMFNGGVATDLSRAQVGAVQSDEILAGGRSNDSESWQMFTTTSSPVGAGAWYWVTAVLDYGGDTVAVYVDGQLVQQLDVDFAQNITPDTPSENSYLGTEANASQGFFLGTMDEARVAGAARSADWLAAQYLSMTDSLSAFGPEETSP